ncbi:MAG: ATP-binding cassette domain-containing protein [Spirochaetales bacterium]|nr:ATP-binding cassette domain-containing protein [Spirochaetales bacterium]
MLNDQSLTIKDVAKFLNISTQMVHILIKKSQLKAFKIGSAIRILSSDLKEFVQSRKAEFQNGGTEYWNKDDSLFVIHNLTCHKGGFYLRDINIGFPKNKLLVLLGPSGSGKSMLLQSIAGILKPDSGSVFLGTHRMDQLAVQDRQVGFVFENYALFENLKALENIAFPLTVQHEKKNIINEKLAEIIREFEIDPKYIPKQIDELPEGMKQLVAIGRERIREIDLFLMDEPMSKLDKHITQLMTVFIKQLINKMNKTTIISLNDPELTMALADYVAVLGGNTLVQFGTIREVYERPCSPFVMELLSRFKTNIIPVEVRGGKTVPLGLAADKADGSYRIGFRAEEIKIADSGIPARVLKSSFYDSRQKIAQCALEQTGAEVELLVPVDTGEEFAFVPVKPVLFES